MLRALTRWASAAAEVTTCAGNDAAVVPPGGASLRQRCRHHSLEAAALAACAQGTSRVDDDVADLAGGVCRAGEQLMVDHQTGTDAFDDTHEQDVPRVARDEGEFAECGGVGVVGNPHWQAEGDRELRSEGDVVETEVGGVDDDAVGVNDAGGGDADSQQRTIGLAGEFAGDLDSAGGEPLSDEYLPRRIATPRAAAGDDLPRQVHDGPPDLSGTAEIEAHDVSSVGDDGDQRGRLAH